MDSVLRPRDIQTRIRSGESPEAVAAAAHTTVDKIMGFAAPVMAERAYIAEQAQKASVRRRAGHGPIGQLGDAVAARLSEQSIDPASVTWDAWRREDGRWAVTAEFGAGQGISRAMFSYDTAGRYVVAEDEESRWLVGERTPGATAAPESSPDAVEETAPAEEPRDEQLALGDDTIAMVTGRPVDTPLEFDVEPLRATRPSARAPEPEPTGDESLTEDLTEAAAAVSAIAAVSGETGDADWIATQASDRPQSPRAVPAHAPLSGSPAATGPAPGTPRPVVAQPTPAAPQAADPAPAPAEAVAEPAASTPPPESAEAPEPPSRPAPKKASKARSRASVPSWDEIMFGSASSDQE